MFKGDIVWAPTSSEGLVVWSFELKFSDDYQSISGSMKLYTDKNKTNIVGKVEFGKDLIYSKYRGGKGKVSRFRRFFIRNQYFGAPSQLVISGRNFSNGVAY